MWIKRSIPVMMTLGNLLCGLLGILFLLTGNTGNGFLDAAPLIATAWLMVAAMLLDFGDGFVARALGVASPLGKELDSLADMVTFGVLPGLISFFIIREGLEFELLRDQMGAGKGFHTTILPWYLAALPYTGLLIPLFSALRLARFNVDERQGDTFYGLPTPANAFFFLSLLLIFIYDTTFAAHFNLDAALSGAAPGIDTGAGLQPFWDAITHPYTVAALSLVFSLLLVLDVRILALKFSNYSLRDNAPRYAVLAVALITGLLLWYKAVPLIILFYLIISFVDNRVKKNEIPG